MSDEAAIALENVGKRYGERQALNALNRELSRTLAESYERFKADDSAWVAIVTGKGRAFCVGRDLKERAAADDAGLPPRPPSNGVVPTATPLMMTLAPAGVDRRRRRPTALSSASTFAVLPASTATFCSKSLWFGSFTSTR